MKPSLVAVVLVLALAGAHPVRDQTSPALPPSRLSVFTQGSWREWWSAERAPVQWAAGDVTLLAGITWRSVVDGVQWGEARLAGRGEAWRLRLIVARIDLAAVRVDLDTLFTAARERPAWSIDAVDTSVVVAVNAGQFPRSMPWGWVVMNGREFLAPGRGPLSTAIAFDSAGSLRWIPGDSLSRPGIARGVTTAFQSYPTLLADDGRVPWALQARGRGLDVEHRDARLAIGQSHDGRLIIALTRFDGAGSTLDFVPFGLTTPEMAAVMGALGARDAVMLDGGISAQMLVRDPAGVRRWTGIRRVPMGMVLRVKG